MTQATDIKTMRGDIKTLKEDVKTLKEDVKTLKEDVKPLKEDVKILKEDVTILKEDVTILKGDMEDVKERLDQTVTKEDAKAFSTKAGVERIFNLLNDQFRAQIEEIKENMLTRREFYEWLTRFDDVLQEIRDMRQNRLLFEKQFVELDDTVANHERRIRSLEMDNNQIGLFS